MGKRKVTGPEGGEMERNARSRLTIVVIISMMLLILFVVSIRVTINPYGRQEVMNSSITVGPEGALHMGTRLLQLYELDSEESFYDVDISPPSIAEAENPDNSIDWGGLFCCLFVMIGTIGVPIVIIIIITKVINNAGEKKKTEKIWIDSAPRQPRSRPGQPVNIKYRTSPDDRIKPINEWKRNEPIVIQKERSAPKDLEIRYREENKAADHGESETHIEEDEMELMSVPEHDLPDMEHIEVDLTAQEVSDEPEMPTFERPKALTDEEKDEFIVERIMELQEMVKEGEIDQDMYDTLKKRLLDQLED